MGRLLHYTKEPFTFERRQYKMDDHWKPVGLWVSVEGEDDWKSWCESESWNTESLAHVSEVTLKQKHNILMIPTLDALDAFNKRFGAGDRHSCRDVAWSQVIALYDGIIIAPYQWERRLDLMWYYGWDCASGCIWNLNVIARIDPLQEPTHTEEEAHV